MHNDGDFVEGMLLYLQPVRSSISSRGIEFSVCYKLQTNSGIYPVRLSYLAVPSQLQTLHDIELDKTMTMNDR